jgi:hypothetical protein
MKEYVKIALVREYGLEGSGAMVKQRVKALLSQNAFNNPEFFANARETPAIVASLPANARPENFPLFYAHPFIFRILARWLYHSEESVGFLAYTEFQGSYHLNTIALIASLVEHMLCCYLEKGVYSPKDFSRTNSKDIYHKHRKYLNQYNNAPIYGTVYTSMLKAEFDKAS